MARTIPMLISALLAVLSVSAAHAEPDRDAKATIPMTQPSPVRNTDEYHLNTKKKNLAIKGYDPVAYFKEGGEKPAKGKESISTQYKGVTYRFASQEHKDKFLKNPARYEPAYGGWCAWAMSTGDKTEIDPKTFIIQNGRLLLFYNGFWGNTKRDWEKGDKDELAKASDEHWKQISGESPRVPSQAPQTP